jgi:DNA (cytosine-5)-methyltransferase 1
MTRNGKLYRRAEPVLPTDASAFSLLPTPVSSDATRGPHWNQRTGASLAFAILRAHRDNTWDTYLPAIRHWETVTETQAPPAVEPNKHGKPRITVEFVIWMMGWPLGWFAGIELARVSQLILLGNGVVPQQAQLAIDGLGIVA